VSGNKRLKNEGRADQSQRLREKRRGQGPRHHHRPQPLGRTSRAVYGPTQAAVRWEEVTMLTILLVVIVVLLLTGGGFG